MPAARIVYMELAARRRSLAPVQLGGLRAFNGYVQFFQTKEILKMSHADMINEYLGDLKMTKIIMRSMQQLLN